MILMVNQLALKKIISGHYLIIKYLELLLKNLFLIITLKPLFMFGKLFFVEILTPPEGIIKF